jgi:hypothetical protein
MGYTWWAAVYNIRWPMVVITVSPFRKHMHAYIHTRRYCYIETRFDGMAMRCCHEIWRCGDAIWRRGDAIWRRVDAIWRRGDTIWRYGDAILWWDMAMLLLDMAIWQWNMTLSKRRYRNIAMRYGDALWRCDMTICNCICMLSHHLYRLIEWLQRGDTSKRWSQ